MTWLYVLMDIIILLVLISLCVLVIILWNKKGRLRSGSLEHFRNDELYERSKEEQKKYKHIDEVSAEDEIILPDTETPAPIEDDSITFSAGYGGMTELEVEDND